MNSDENKLLFNKLNRFINKYYKNKILKGILLLCTALLLFLIVFSAFEYAVRFNKNIRIILFWIYFIINLSIFIYYLLIPILNLFRIGEIISYEEAAIIIGKFFPEIDDKILNVLQLNQLNKNENSLIEASIIQKTKRLSSFSFRKVVKYSENKNYLKWLSFPILIILIILISGNKHVITESSARIIEYNREFIPKAPFKFEVINENLNVIQYENINVKLKLNGEKIPNNVSIEVNGNLFTMKKKDLQNFEYEIVNIDKDTKLRFYASGFYSRFYKIKVLYRPAILEFTTTLDYPSYTGMINDKFENIGDLTVPEGTKINWDFTLINSDSLFFTFNDLNKKIKIGTMPIQIEKKIKSTCEYSVLTKNNFLISKENKYSISVIKDQYPTIEVDEFIDTISKKIYYTGVINDDYGLNKLIFKYSLTQEDTTLEHERNIKINKLTEEKFYYMLDLDSLKLNPSDKIIYYYEVWDNDNVNGNKCTKSKRSIYEESSIFEIKENITLSDEKIKNSLDHSISLAKEIESDINDLKESLINEKQLGWEEKKKLQNIINKQKELKDQIIENNKNNKENNLNKEKINSSILEKSKELEKIMDKLLDDETKKILQEMEDLLEKMDKKEIKEILDKMEMNNSNLEDDLDRNLELYKELEFEQKLEENINNIDNLIKKQKELKSETENDKSKENQNLYEKQESLQQELNELKNNLDELKEKNNNLENKKELPEINNEQNNANESMDKSKNSLKKNKKKNSIKEQEQVIENLERISEKLKNTQQSNSEMQSVENMETLRQILENLIKLSFEQESLINSISKLPKNSTSITKYIQIQKKISDDSKIIEDSLLALSKRVIQIESIINKEIKSINYNIEKSITLLEERNIRMGTSKQQFVMTSINNLALLLSETLKQMQIEMANNNPGTKQCNKPGSGTKPSLEDIKNMQKKLNEQMKKQNGENGNKGENEKGKNNEGENMILMQLSQQQEKIRKKLLEIRNESENSGNKGEIDQILEKMEETENDILNNMITNETILRQKDILTRLLNAENAQREKEEKEEKRESNEWILDNKNNDVRYLDYINKKRENSELLNSNPINLNPFYKEKVNKYFNRLIEN